MSELADPIRIGRYTVLRRVGGGGVGVVYAAFDPELERNVAVKLLQPSTRRGAGAADASERLVREARAMAKLSHPHVIAVYEVGRHEDLVYIAMELVEGIDLRQWLKTPRPWREVRDHFVAAGQGLAAAHRAEIVHRDFKPPNVLLGDDGRVRVLDFGLAKLAIDERRDSSASGSSVAAPKDAELTREGVVMGTPPYMAPEQHTGAVMDARGDQYSFCVSLYEGLYGVRPFVRGSLAELLEDKTELRLQPLPAGAPRIPAWLHSAVLRGLQPTPEDRHPTMEHLLAAIDRDPGRKARRWGAVSVLAVGVSVAVFSWGRAGVDPCAEVDRELRGIWDDEVRGEVVAAFASAGRELGQTHVVGVLGLLDEYAEVWRIRRLGLCREEAEAEAADTRVLEQRACLDQRRRALAETTRMLAHADATIAENAATVVADLPRPEDCDHPPALPAEWENIDRALVEDVESKLARARALMTAGKPDDARALADDSLERAKVAGYRRGEALALLLQGTVDQMLGHAREAEGELMAALELAERIQDDHTGARALTELVFVIGIDQQRSEEGLRLIRIADAKLERVGDDPRVEADLLTYRGIIFEQTARYEEALQSHNEAIAIRAARHGEKSLAVAGSLSNVGNVLSGQGKHAEAVETLQQSLDIYVDLLGPDHPSTASPRGNLASALVRADRLDEGEAAMLTNIALLERVFGRNHPMRISTLNNLGSVLKARGEPEAALARFEEALAVATEVLGSQHPTTSGLHTNVGSALADLGRDDEAMPHLREALDGWREALGTDHPTLGYAYENIGEAHAAAGRTEEARRSFRSAIELRERTLGPDHPLTEVSRESLGSVAGD